MNVKVWTQTTVHKIEKYNLQKYKKMLNIIFFSLELIILIFTGVANILETFSINRDSGR